MLLKYHPDSRSEEQTPLVTPHRSSGARIPRMIWPSRLGGPNSASRSIMVGRVSELFRNNLAKTS